MKRNKHYLKGNSPFLPSVDLLLLNSMIRDLFLEQGYYAGESIAKGLLHTGVISVMENIVKKARGRQEFIDHFTEYTKGFNRPLVLLQVAYAGLAGGLNDAYMLLNRFSTDEEGRFARENLPFAVKLLEIDPSGVRLVEEVVERELQESTNQYYQIGLQAAKQTFTSYSEIMDTLVDQLARQDREPPRSLLPPLKEYEKTVVSSPTAVPPKVAGLERAFAQLAQKPSCSTVLLIFLRYPGLLLHAFRLAARLIYNARKDLNGVLRELQKANNAMTKVKTSAEQEWNPGELVSRVAPQFEYMEEKLSQIAPVTPYPSQSFVKDIRRIRALSQRGDDNSSVERVLETWEQLAGRSSLEEFSAVWTTVHMAWGDLAERYFAETGKKQFVRMARRAYSAPLKKRSIWRADLGSRCICGARLGELLVKYGDSLEMPAPELARAIYDAYKDVLQGNERLYQRSPYRESRENLQDRTALAVTRAIESCIYLSEHELEAASWLRSATLIAENGKSRMLRGEMALAKRLPPSKVPLRYANDEDSILDRLREIYAMDLVRGEYELPAEQSLAGEISEADRLRLDLETVWTRMEEFGEAARDYVSVRRDEGIRWEDAKGLADRLGKKFAIISIYRLPDSIFLSVLREGWNAPRVFIVSLSRQEIQEALFQCHTRLSTDWQTLGDRLFSALTPLLKDVEYLYFLPHGPFNRLPLHALTIEGKPIIERWAVAYAPSVSVLESALTRPKSQGNVLVIGYAPSEENRADKWIKRESEVLAEYLQVKEVLPDMCNSKFLKELGPSARIIHLACHGEFIQQSPLGSYIFLADGPFTARDWAGLRLQADLVTLSACETGVSNIRPGGDPEGLMRAILFAGASSLLTTLWAVHSSTTFEWMIEFYRNIWDEEGTQIADKADAFRKATLALRERYPNPYHWAPFVLVGSYL